jgi:MYXO-CTERM domain-containing protein
MNKALSLLLAFGLLAVPGTQAAIIFDPANPLNVVDEGGFTGTSTVGSNPYSQARLLFSFSGLNPDPLTSTFQITNISLKGVGITGSLSFADVTVTGNSFFLTSWVNLNASQLTVDLTGSQVSFNLPGGYAINDGADLSVFVRYASANEFNVLTSTTGPIFMAQNVGPEPIPEPGTWAAAVLLAGGAALARWRRRRTA